MLHSLTENIPVYKTEVTKTFCIEFSDAQGQVIRSQWSDLV